jgi:hypothetical protein
MIKYNQNEMRKLIQVKIQVKKKKERKNLLRS